MTTLYSAGPYDTINFIAQAVKRTSTAVTSDTVFPEFPLPAIYDGELNSITKINSSNPTFSADLAFNLNPSFTTWSGGLPVGWDDVSIGTGSIEEENTIVNSSPASVQLNSTSASNNGRVRQINKVMAGNPYTVTVFLRGDGTNDTSLYIKNLHTGDYLNSSSVWVTTKTATFIRTTATFGGATRNFTVEESNTLSSVVDLELRVEQENGTGYADDIVIWPHWNVAAVFGHNIPDVATAIIQSDDDVGFPSPTTRITYAAPRRRPAFYGIPAATVTERFVRLDTVYNARPDNVYISEWFVGYTRTLTRGIGEPLSVRRHTDLSGGYYGLPFSVQDDESAVYTTKIPHVTLDEWRELSVRVGRAGKWGGEKTLLIPDSSLPEVHLGYWSISETAIDDKFSLDGEFRELPYTPIVE